MWKWRLKAVALSLAAAYAMTFAGSAGSAHAGGTKLRIGTDAASPPLTYIGQDGRLAGFDIEIGNAMCKAMDVECEWVIADDDELVPGLTRQRYDAVISSLAMTLKRKEAVDFTRSYHLLPASFLGSESLASVEIGKDTLSGKTIGVIAGSTHETFLRDNFGDIATIRNYEHLAKATLDLTGRRIDLVFGDRILLVNDFLKSNEGKGFRLLGPSYTDAKWFGDGAGIAVRKGNIGLKWRLNSALTQIREDGTYKKINDRYFDFDVYGS